MTEEDIDKKANNCRIALKAAIETIADYCGLAPSEEIKAAFGETVAPPYTVGIEGVTVSVPEEIHEIAHSNPELTEEDRIQAIKESSWAQHEAEGLCEKLFGATGAELESCVDRVSIRLAEGMVG